jgi:hypothetical protein
MVDVTMMKMVDLSSMIKILNKTFEQDLKNSNQQGENNNEKRN